NDALYYGKAAGLAKNVNGRKQLFAITVYLSFESSGVPDEAVAVVIVFCSDSFKAQCSGYGKHS
ncbi:MAG: hypothetical protein ACOC36_03035, partial [Fibrobacterota bacterium]